jgi:capsular exopolysaccharide synthesis family protein
MKELVIRQTSPEKTLRDFYYVIFRQKRKIIIFFCTVMICTALGTFLATKIYQSEATLMVKLGRESVSLDPTATTGQVLQLNANRENEIKSELDILQSRALAEQVVDSIGYQKFLRPLAFLSFLSFGNGSDQDGQLRQRDQVVRTLMKNLDIETQKNSNIISINYKADDPELAQAVVNKLISFYLEKHINVHRTAGSDDFFKQQSNLLRAKLAQGEENLRDLKNKSGIASVTEQRTILLNRIGGLQKDLEQTEADLAASHGKIKSMEDTFRRVPKTLLRLKVTGYSGNPVDYLQQKLHDLQLKEQDLLSKFQEKNNLVQETRRQIKEIQGLLDKEGATKGQVSSLALINEKANLSELEGKKKVLKNELILAQGELKGINDYEVKIAALQRNVDLLNTNYRNYSEKLEQARIDQALNLEKISNISIVQAATLPVKPIRPRKALNLALGTFLGIFGGLGLAFLSESMDHTFKTPNDVLQRLELPILAAIPQFTPDDFKGYLDTNNPLLLPEPSAGWEMAADLNRRCQLEPLNVLCLDHYTNPSQVIAITSCLPGEGVSTFAANLSLNLVHQKGERVLLVDANLANPSVHKMFKVDQSPGLAEMFGPDHLNQNLIQPTAEKNLDVLPSGRRPVNPWQLFEAKWFADQLALWRREYQYVIFDLPPLNGSPHATRLVRLADGAILVVEAERTRWEVAQQAKEILAQNKAEVLGVVLNKRQFPIPEKLYRAI